MSTYNGHKYLNQQFESLAGQTLAGDMTVYVRDDGSTDDTLQIIEKWQKRIKIILYKECNVGPARSFWQLFMNPEINADYYAFCDQDDIWDNDKLAIAVQHLNDKTHFYACNCRIIDENGTVVEPVHLINPPRITIPRLFVSGCTQGCSMVFTDALRQYVKEQNPLYVPMHDIVLMLYSLYYGDIYWDYAPHFSYRIHSGNVVAKNNKSRLQQLQTTLWNWKNSSVNSMSFVAQEMLERVPEIDNQDGRYLKNVARYRHSLSSKCSILSISDIQDMPHDMLRSYRVRILLNLY